jgi:GMP synthase (glutamine-hydrolysing)
VQNLAESERCPNQALRVRGKPVYATQFHPELTWRDNRKRFERYMSIYGKLFGDKEALSRLESHTPGPEANMLLPRFVERIVGAGGTGGAGGEGT